MFHNVKDWSNAPNRSIEMARSEMPTRLNAVRGLRSYAMRMARNSKDENAKKAWLAWHDYYQLVHVAISSGIWPKGEHVQFWELHGASRLLSEKPEPRPWMVEADVIMTAFLVGNGYEEGESVELSTEP